MALSIKEVIRVSGALGRCIERLKELQLKEESMMEDYEDEDEDDIYDTEEEKNVTNKQNSNTPTYYEANYEKNEGKDGNEQYQQQDHYNNNNDNNNDDEDDDSGEQMMSVSAILEQQRRLEMRYEELLNQRPEKKGKAAREEQQRRDAELAEIAEKLREYTKILCRQLKEKPNQEDNWNKVRKERGNIQYLLEQCVGELESSLIHNKDRVREREERGRKILYDSNNKHEDAIKGAYDSFRSCVFKIHKDNAELETYARLEKDALEEKKRLMAELEEEREMQERELQERGDKITELKTNLRSQKMLLEEETEMMKKEAEAESESRRREEQIEIRELEDDLRKVRIELDIEKRAHSRAKAFYQKHHDRLGKLVEEYNRLHEDSQKKLDRSIRDLRTKREKMTAKKVDLSERVTEAEKQREEQKEKEKQQEEEEKAEQERKKQLREAAERIQELWRGYAVREQRLKNAKKNKKKKKKKNKS